MLIAVIQMLKKLSNWKTLMIYKNIVANLTSSSVRSFSYRTAVLLSISVFSTGMLLSGTAVVSAQDANTVIAKVGDSEITEKLLTFTQEEMAQQFASVPETDRRAAALAALIDIKLLSLLAEKEGLGKGEEFEQRMEFLRARTLHNTYFDSKVAKAVTDEEIKARYEKEVAAAPAVKQVSARHILVKTEEEAKAIIAELEGGKDFVELAKEKSTGPSGPKGGDLGFFGAGQMVPEFEKAAFALEKGGVTKEPVKTQFGFHIIKKEDERDAPKPKLEDVTNKVRQVLLREKYLAALKAAKAANATTILDEELKTKIEANLKK